MKRFGLQIKYEVTNEEIGVSSENMGIYDEMRELSHGLRWKSRVSDK